jgi:hypothetical protein
MDQRKSPRFKARFDALYASGLTEGAGVLVDLSYSGARLEDVSVQPELGTQVRIYVFIQPVAPFELLGHVARHTDSGFAMRCDIFDPEIRRLVDDICALVELPD